MFKKENGITLVALVITIIVLLILAGVSISMISGDDGIASRAGEAKTKTSLGNAQEGINLAISSANADYWAEFAEGNNPTKPSTVDQIKDEIEAQGYKVDGEVSETDVDGVKVFTFDLAEKSAANAQYTVTLTRSAETGLFTNAAVANK